MIILTPKENRNALPFCGHGVEREAGAATTEDGAKQRGQKSGETGAEAIPRKPLAQSRSLPPREAKWGWLPPRNLFVFVPVMLSSH